MNRERARQYTIRSVPAALDRVLRRWARRERKSLNEVALEALRRGAGPPEAQPIFTDLDDCIGTWEDDPAVEAALAGQDRVERRLWR
jgi:hypothetical protein